ncbi:MAG: hypothetical protein OEZ02_04380 [Anaerolineae bacterium]|nr:hypothetical protein [Anaerolineae bacterium]
MDFSGAWQRDASGYVTAGLSNLTNLSLPAGWDVLENGYSQIGYGPILTIAIDMGLGNLDIKKLTPTYT